MNYRKVTRSYVHNIALSVTDLLFPSAILQKNRQLKDKHRGRRCFVLGSGSSIELYDLKLLENEFVITQNNFHKHADIGRIKPNLHCVVPFYQTEKEYQVWKEWLQEMKDSIPEECLYFFGLNTKNIAEKVFGRSENVFYFSSRYRVLTLTNEKLDLSSNIMEIPTALTLCLIAAVYMGFSEIILLGFDFDQIISNQQKSFNRFYGKSKITDTDSERSTELKYVGAAYESAWFHRWLTIKQLNAIQRFAKGRGIRIVNGSEEGILDVYERVPVGKDFSKIFP